MTHSTLGVIIAVLTGFATLAKAMSELCDE